MTDAPDPTLGHEITTTKTTTTTYKVAPHADPNSATLIGAGCLIDTTTQAPPATRVPPELVDLVLHVHVEEDVTVEYQLFHPGTLHEAVEASTPE